MNLNQQCNNEPHLHTVSNHTPGRLPQVVVRELDVAQRVVFGCAAEEDGSDGGNDVRCRASALQILQQPRELLLQHVGRDGEGAIAAERGKGRTKHTASALSLRRLVHGFTVP